jgi:hypothetical protein
LRSVPADRERAYKSLHCSEIVYWYSGRGRELENGYCQAKLVFGAVFDGVHEIRDVFLSHSAAHNPAPSV